jgi:hypothetical protein
MDALVARTRTGCTSTRAWRLHHGGTEARSVLGRSVGLLLNFNVSAMKNGIVRRVL